MNDVKKRQKVLAIVYLDSLNAKKKNWDNENVHSKTNYLFVTQIKNTYFRGYLFMLVV